MRWILHKVRNGYLLENDMFNGSSVSDSFVFKDSWELHCFLQDLTDKENNSAKDA